MNIAPFIKKFHDKVDAMRMAQNIFRTVRDPSFKNELERSLNELPKADFTQVTAQEREELTKYHGALKLFLELARDDKEFSAFASPLLVEWAAKLYQQIDAHLASIQLAVGKEEFGKLAQSGIARSYGENEPEYYLTDLEEINYV